MKTLICQTTDAVANAARTLKATQRMITAHHAMKGLSKMNERILQMEIDHIEMKARAAAAELRYLRNEQAIRQASQTIANLMDLHFQMIIMAAFR